MAKRLFGQSDKKYNKEYWGRLERNWKQWKGKQRKESKMYKQCTKSDRNSIEFSLSTQTRRIK